MDVQLQLNKDFIDVVQRMVSRYMPNASEQDRDKAHAELAEFAQIVTMQTAQYLGAHGKPWDCAMERDVGRCRFGPNST